VRRWSPRARSRLAVAPVAAKLPAHLLLRRSFGAARRYGTETPVAVAVGGRINRSLQRPQPVARERNEPEADVVAITGAQGGEARRRHPTLAALASCQRHYSV